MPFQLWGLRFARIRGYLHGPQASRHHPTPSFHAPPDFHLPRISPVAADHVPDLTTHGTRRLRSLSHPHAAPACLTYYRPLSLSCHFRDRQWHGPDLTELPNTRHRLSLSSPFRQSKSASPPLNTWTIMRQAVQIRHQRSSASCGAREATSSRDPLVSCVFLTLVGYGSCRLLQVYVELKLVLKFANLLASRPFRLVRKP
jgi:hypothetical protein